MLILIALSLRSLLHKNCKRRNNSFVERFDLAVLSQKEVDLMLDYWLESANQTK